MSLTITKEKVLEAAEKCPQAKEALKTLFPDVFERSLKIDNPTTFLSSIGGVNTIGVANGVASDIFDRPELAEKCYFLEDRYFNWKMTDPIGGYRLLIPTKK